MKRIFVWGTLAALLCPFGVESARADDVHGPFHVVTDTNTQFRAIGSLTTVDRDNPVNGVGGTPLTVESAANPKWSFKIEHLTGAPHYQNIQGDWHFRNVGVAIQGGRPGNIGHIATPHAGEQANALPRAVTPPRKRDDLEMGKRGRSRSTGGLQGHNPQHWDMYNIEARVAALAGTPNAGGAAPGPPNLLTGPVEITARHRQGLGEKGSRSHGGSFYSDPEGGTWISYDAKTKLITFHIGEINGLDLKGGEEGGVAPAFKGDALLEGEWKVEPIEYMGENGGVYEFEGGEVSVTDEADRFDFSAEFEKFVIGDSTRFPVMESFGVLTSWDISRTGDACCGSAFLEAFVAYNLLGHGMSEETEERWRGLDFAFVTEKDLAGATEAFTVSAEKIPATVYVTLNLEPVEEEMEQQMQETGAGEKEDEEEGEQATEAEEEKEGGLAEQVTDFLERTFPGLREE